MPKSLAQFVIAALAVQSLLLAEDLTPPTDPILTSETPVRESAITDKVLRFTQSGEICDFCKRELEQRNILNPSIFLPTGK